MTDDMNDIFEKIRQGEAGLIHVAALAVAAIQSNRRKRNDADRQV